MFRGRVSFDSHELAGDGGGGISKDVTTNPCRRFLRRARTTVYACRRKQIRFDRSDTTRRSSISRLAMSIDDDRILPTPPVGVSFLFFFFFFINENFHSTLRFHTFIPWFLSSRRYIDYQPVNRRSNSGIVRITMIVITSGGIIYETKSILSLPSFRLHVYCISLKCTGL